MYQKTSAKGTQGPIVTSGGEIIDDRLGALSSEPAIGVTGPCLPPGITTQR